MNSPTTTSRKRKLQERTEITRSKILDAALTLFSEKGYEGVTVRDIELAAKVQRGLVVYHFHKKENLWKQVVDSLFQALNSHMEKRTEVFADLPPVERIAFLVRIYVRFAAGHPQLNRLMMHEGKQSSWRLDYIVTNYTTDLIDDLKKIAIDDAGIEPDQFVHWYYLFIGSSGLFFSVAPEVKALFGVDVTDESVLEAHANFMVDFLLKGRRTS